MKMISQQCFTLLSLIVVLSGTSTCVGQTSLRGSLVDTSSTEWNELDDIDDHGNTVNVQDNGKAERELKRSVIGFGVALSSIATTSFDVEWYVDRTQVQKYYIEFVDIQNDVTDPNAIVQHSAFVYPQADLKGKGIIRYGFGSGWGHGGTFNIRLVNSTEPATKAIYSYTNQPRERITVNWCASSGNSCNCIGCQACNTCGCGWHGGTGMFDSRWCNNYQFTN